MIKTPRATRRPLAAAVATALAVLAVAGAGVAPVSAQHTASPDSTGKKHCGFCWDGPTGLAT